MTGTDDKSTSHFVFGEVRGKPQHRRRHDINGGGYIGCLLMPHRHKRMVLGGLLMPH